MEFFQAISFEKAKESIIHSLRHIRADQEKVDLPQALHRIAATHVIAQENLPPFSRSTVDGFAVRSADTFGASESAPSLFLVAGEVSMGAAASMTLQPGEAVIIPTGGMLPPGADAVVMVEHSEQPDDQTALITKMVAPGENVVMKGEDLSIGTTIVAEGQKITSPHIGALAAAGMASVNVRKKIFVTILSTGDELVDITATAEVGQIRDTNSYALAAMLEAYGCEVRRWGIVKDRYEDFSKALADALSYSDVVVISGGSSVGTRDYTVQAIKGMNQAQLLFHGLAIKPGKPTIYGIVGSVPVFGLPGHPVAAMTICELLVKLAIRQLQGHQEASSRHTLVASLTRNIPSAPGRDDFFPAKLFKQEGQYRATPLFGKSGLIHLLTEADGLIHIPSEKSGLYEGDKVDVLVMT
ncbi:molybdopterin molybdotransferase MoeA [Heliorestis convoluta]|uniref:Molybdopterin molybdenumtransferase n=1 Tax=Heliorestis convoluta TaxID=356322 RepID=A0A5Q2N144_9FIRM|nr:gephyrin-like molybdotransferase Glp [Heliorestis convoluta]QGG47012.1 Molybdopterin biosynthesis protein MoeA [Heliorestis convoluta]